MCKLDGLVSTEVENVFAFRTYAKNEKQKKNAKC